MIFDVMLTNPSANLKAQYPGKTGEDYRYLPDQHCAVRVDDRNSKKAGALGKLPASYYLSCEDSKLPNWIGQEHTNNADITYQLKTEHWLEVGFFKLNSKQLPLGKKNRNLEVWVEVARDFTCVEVAYKVTVTVRVKNSRWLNKLQTLPLSDIEKVAQNALNYLLVRQEVRNPV